MIVQGVIRTFFQKEIYFPIEDYAQRKISIQVYIAKIYLEV